MIPSPIRAEYHRWTSESSASTTASPAIKNAILIMAAEAPGTLWVMWFTTRPARTGVATPIPASRTTAAMKTVIAQR